MAERTPGTPALMRAINDRAALAIMLDNQPISRNRLSALSDLSKPTASLIVRRLENAQLIEPVGTHSGTSGPATVLYGVRADRVLGVAMDVQSERILSTIVDATGTDHPIAETPRARPNADRTAIAELESAIGAACRIDGSEPAAVSALCVGLQAAIDAQADELLLPHLLQGWPTTGVKATLERQSGRSVILSNDANLAAVAERASGAAEGAHSFALLWLGIGLGFAVDLDGRILGGAHGAAGEIGRLRVPGDIAGMTASGAKLDDLLGWPIVEQLARRHGITGESLDESARMLAGHPESLAFFEELAPIVALAIPPALAVLDPELIVLGGPIGTAGGAYLAELVVRHVAVDYQPAPQIVPTSIGADPVLIGAREVLSARVRAHLLDEAAGTRPA